MNYINEKLVVKVNMLAESNILQKALHHYVDGLDNAEPRNIKSPLFGNEDVGSIVKKKSKFFYTCILESEIPRCQAFWCDVFNKDINFTSVYNNKVTKMSDVKLAETNFKILHNILPCGENLVKWKKKNDDKCSLCCEKETIIHMLYKCKYVNPFWRIVEDALSIVIDIESIFLGIDEHIDKINLNTCISVIVYVIYKSWLESSLTDKARNLNNIIKDFELQIKYYRDIYNKTRCLKDVCAKLKLITDNIM